MVNICKDLNNNKLVVLQSRAANFFVKCFTEFYTTELIYFIFLINKL